MGDRIPSFPSISELFRHGLVAPLAILSGFVFLVIGATGDLAPTNQKLLMGASLLFFGITWHNASQATDVVSDVTGSSRTWDKPKLFTSIIFFLFFLFAGYELFAGSRNVFQRKENCERYAIELQNQFKESGDTIPGVTKGSYYIERSFYSPKRNSCVCVLGTKVTVSADTAYDVYAIDSLTKKLLWSRRFTSSDIVSGEFANEMESQANRFE